MNVKIQVMQSENNNNDKFDHVIFRLFKQKTFASRSTVRGDLLCLSVPSHKCD
jgi:hypothetical protein